MCVEYEDLDGYNSKKQNFMEADPGTINKKIIINEIITREKKQTCDNVSNLGNVLLTTRLRRDFRYNNEVERFILERGLSFLFYISIFFWSLFLLFG